MSNRRILIIIMICTVIAFSAFIVSAEESPPNLPVILYGNVNIDGKPAPAGTTISAKAGDSLVGATKVLTVGTYGDMANNRLPVSSGTDGSVVDFYVNNIKAMASTTFKYYSEDAGKRFQVDLNVQSAQSGVTSGNADSSGNGGGSGGGGNVDKKGTATPTASQIGVPIKESVTSTQAIKETTGKPDTSGSGTFQFNTILGIFVLLVLGIIIISVKKKGGKI